MKIAAKISISVNTTLAPDAFHHDKSKFSLPPDDFVISKDSSGAIISKFSDSTWDLTPYSTVGPCVLNWCSWSEVDSPLKTQINHELRLLCFSLLYFDKSRLSVGTIRSHISSLRAFAKICLDSNCTISNSSTSRVLNNNFKTSLSAATRSQIEGIHTILLKLLDIQSRHPELGLKFSSGLLNITLHYLELIPKGYKQTPIIPTRVYAETISKLQIFIDDVLVHAPAIHEFFSHRYRTDSSYGFSKITSKQRGIFHNKSVTFDEALKTHGLRDFCVRHKVIDNKNLYALLSDAQTACKWFIHIFTGMRDTECRTLPLDSLKSIKTPQGVAYVFEGYTSKLTGDGQQPTYWITSEEAEPAFKCAQALAHLIYVKNGLNPTNYDILPLFPMIQPEIGTAHSGYKIPLAKLAAQRSRVLSVKLDVRIHSSDLEELEEFDGFRHWRDDIKFNVGSVWVFSSHQARRSLAVYAARSGLVSIGSLGLQFKHLTQAMTCYYMNNSSFAVNFVRETSQQELIDHLHTERKIAEFINYDSNVINSRSILFGGEGTRIQLAKNKSRPVQIELDRDNTKKKFLNGEMANRPTPLGSCSSILPCSKISFTSVLCCVDCPQSIFNADSIPRFAQTLRSIKLKKNLFSQTSPSFIQLEHEEIAIIKILEKFKP